MYNEDNMYIVIRIRHAADEHLSQKQNLYKTTLTWTI